MSVNTSASDYSWEIISEYFHISNFKEIFETSIKIETDRNITFKTHPLRQFSTENLTLMKGSLPDLRFQDIHIATAIGQEVDAFMDRSSFLGLLIGPTGCGKSYEMISRAKKEFTVFIDAQDYSASSDFADNSLKTLKQRFKIKAGCWKEKNENMAELQTLAYAFVLSRMFFLRFLKSKYPGLTPTQFLLHQMLNSMSIQNCFIKLAELSMTTLTLIRNSLVFDPCLFCVDEAHVLISHLGETIITSAEGEHIQNNGDVNNSAKRGTLSVILHAIREGQFAKKVLFAGTSSKLRNIENFGTFETKPVNATILNGFKAWDRKMAMEYVNSLVNIDGKFLEIVLTDYYRPRVLENFVYDLFQIAMNDTESPQTLRKRMKKFETLEDINDILIESYRAIIHRFTRVTIAPLCSEIKKSGHTKTLLKLLFASMMTCRSGPITGYLEDHEVVFFTDTIGSVYLIPKGNRYSFYEGYVIESFLAEFENALQELNLQASLKILRSIIAQEGKKTTAKGTPFEAVVLADLRQKNAPFIADVLGNFGVSVSECVGRLQLPTKVSDFDDDAIISARATNCFFRPSNHFRPDILAFLSKDVSLSFGIKLYTSEVDFKTHNDNFKSTDPKLFFLKEDRPTNTKNRSKWEESLKRQPIKLAVRILIELPETVKTVDTKIIQNSENVVIVVTTQNMEKILSEDVCRLIRFITNWPRSKPHLEI
jgi:hypothetical protein